MDRSEEKLKSVYYDPNSHGSFGSIKKLYDSVKDEGFKYKQVENWLNKQSTYNLFRKSIKNFPRLPILVDKVDEQWQADLMDMTWVSRENDNYKYILVIIDCLSRYAWAKPVKDKSSGTIINSFKEVFKERKAEKLQTDQGKEFVNQNFKLFMKEMNINFFTSTDDVIKCAIVERFNRTLRTRIYRYMHYKNTQKYIDVLGDIINGYNSSYHRTIKMSPKDALTNQSKARQNIFKAQPINKKKQTPYKLNDFVRITRAKALFEKGATSNWTEELFKIIKVKHTPQGYVYRLSDWSNEPITSIFYHDEIFPVEEPDLYKIERIIRTRINPITKNKEYFVKWLGYPDKFNSWVQDVE